jgi:hypothetical protein
MSFIFTVSLSRDDEMSKADLNRWHPADSKVELRLYKSIFSKHSTTLGIEKHGQGPHGLLTDNADPDALFWDIHPELLPEIAHLLILLRQNTKSGFLFRAYWAGDRSLEQVEISIDDLVKVIEAGKIGTKTKYLVY